MNRLIIILTLLPFLSLAQNTLGPASQGIDFNSYAFGTIDEFDDRDKSVKGSPYLFSDFKDLVVLTDSKDTILFADANFNLSSMNIEFKKDDGMRFFSSKYFDTFYEYKIISSRYFVKKFSLLGEEQVSGLFQVLNENPNYTLLQYYEFKIKESNYNPVLDHGNKNDEIKIDEHQYLLHNFQLIPIDGSKRKFSKYFSRKDEILSYIRDNKLSFKDLKDLTELTNYLDENQFEVNL